MTPEEAKKLPKKIPNVLDGLPAHLKDPENFDKIQKALLETLATRHSHSDILAWGSCRQCAPKLRNHREMMVKLGFKSPAQYMQWRKVHTFIKERVRLQKYDE